MNYNDVYIMELTKAAIFDKHPINPNANLDWKYIYNKSSEQNITGLLFCAISKLDEKYTPDKEILNLFKNSMIATISLMAAKYKEFLHMNSIVNKNELTFIGFKGCVVRSLYAVPELRTMGDFDVFTEKKQINQIAKLFIDNGYNVKKDSFGIICENKNTYWEIFETVEDEFRINTDKWNNLFYNNTMTDNEIKTVTPTYFLIQLLVHIGKHCVRAGAGIRNLCDTALFINKYKKEIDFDVVRNACKEQGFEVIYDYIINTMNKWFDIDINDIQFNEKNCDVFIEYTLLNGVFGKQGNTMVSQVTKHEDDTISGMRKILFPGVKILSPRYRYLKKAPYLLPIAWCHRIFNGLFKWNYSAKQMLGDMKEALEYSKERLEWLEKLGLDDK